MGRGCLRGLTEADRIRDAQHGWHDPRVGAVPQERTAAPLAADQLKQRADPPSIDSNRAAGDVARTLGGKERRERREFARLSETPHWDFLLPFGNDVRVRRAGFA